MKNKLKQLSILSLASFAIIAGCVNGCDSVAYNEDLAEAERQTGRPAINSPELRDDPNFVTYVYIVAMDGSLKFLTKAMGYGFPYSTQYTAPERYYGYGANTPMPEPNGFFIPDGMSATWIMAIGPDGETFAMYVEPQIVVSPVKLH